MRTKCGGRERVHRFRVAQSKQNCRTKWLLCVYLYDKVGKTDKSNTQQLGLWKCLHICRYKLDLQPQPYNPAQMLPKNMCYDKKHLSKLYKYKLYPFCLNEVFLKMISFLLILIVCIGQWLDGKLKAVNKRVNWYSKRCAVINDKSNG